MQDMIDNQLSVIQRYIQWTKDAFDKGKSKEVSSKMADYRRSLKRKKFFSTANPAAAIYGESQVGKSYLISSLLSNAKNPFSVMGHNFIEEINPIGGGSESTSLVSRFSSKYIPIDVNYPVKAVLLSPADLVLVLCDCYYNDIKQTSSGENAVLSVEKINEEVAKLMDNYGSSDPKQNVLSEDDIYDIRDYFRAHFGAAAYGVLDSEFFTEIHFFISNIHPNKWGSVFELLWNKNEFFSDIFEKLIGEYQKLRFEQSVFLPIDALLNNSGTLLDVQCLRHLDTNYRSGTPNYKEKTKLILANGDDFTLDKSVLCALTAELVFAQEQKQEKEFLNKMDLLDFPGARARMEVDIDSVKTENIPDLLLRGKVAYLFNKYSEEEKINVLIFCAKHTQTSQRFMPKLLNDWINKVIGKTPDEREEYMKYSEISPLFIVGTFFNVNLAFDPLQDKKGDDSTLNYRWQQRFDRTLAEEYLEVKTHDWFENWTKSKPNFQNIYLLRDFEKSETPSNLFTGYNEFKEERTEVKPASYMDFREKLRESFLKYDFVRKHFENPDVSWDESATINKDGTGLIIEKLNKVSDKINVANSEKVKRELMKIREDVMAEISKYFHSNDKDDELRKAKSLAGEIQYKLDCYFRGDGINTYGLFIKEMNFRESETIKCFKEIIDDIEHRDNLNLDKYSTYRMQVPVRDDDTVDSYFQRLCDHYEKQTEDDKNKLKDQLQEEGVDLSTLIHFDSDLVKGNAKVLAETLVNKWSDKMRSESQLVVQKVLGGNVLDVVEMYEKLFDKYQLVNCIAKQIRQYVNSVGKANFPYEIVADISTEMLNSFVNTVGYNMLTPSDINGLKKANEENNLNLSFDEEAGVGADTVETLFERIDNWDEIIQKNPEELRTMPTYQNYLNWYRRIKVGFVSVCDIPNYDVALNDKLGEIINECQTIKY